MAQPKTDPIFKQLIIDNKNPVFLEVMNHPEKYRLQIIYTEINRDHHNKPSFQNHFYNYDKDLYFNPASMVKMPLAFLALEKLNELNKAGIDKHTTIFFDSSETWHRPLYRDETSLTGLPSIAQLIRRAFLVSENDPYNRLYQFVGQGETNKNLIKKGYKDLRITRQFMGLTPDQNSVTNPVRFVDEKGNTIYHQPTLINKEPFDFSRIIKLGNGYMNREDSLVMEPFDFTVHNYLSLEVMQRMLRDVMFPNTVPKNKRFNLKKDDYRFLYQYLSQYPSETPYPKYDEKKYHDSYVKFFFMDSSKLIPVNIRVFNKVGWAYGFLTDVSYVVDFKNKIEYMLSATVYVNSDGILNDGKYDYDTIGNPFMRSLGESIYQYDLKRKRNYKPDLSEFSIDYEKRLPDDQRPVLKDVDN